LGEWLALAHRGERERFYIQVRIMEVAIKHLGGIPAR
jgi:hypothetical protein